MTSLRGFDTDKHLYAVKSKCRFTPKGVAAFGLNLHLLLN